LALGASGTTELEPIFRFELWLPSVYVGRAIADVLKMRGTFEDPETVGDMSILRGRVPQATSQYYEVELADYTGGKGIVTFLPDGYIPVKEE
jgi:translation elongation factor EF-G